MDIYKGKTTTSDGKIKHLRQYEFLNLYLIDKPKTDADKNHNKHILQLANIIKNQRELGLQTHKYGFDSKSDYKDTNFYEYKYCKRGTHTDKKINNQLRSDVGLRDIINKTIIKGKC